ncbi:hypothetical protein [Flavobacterium sp. 1355]|jgi:hypothetical protein|nr:hypothetical protein [Flavobacterium sp. 1355]MBP1223088.1 hypothetical protein [Flavobacterium sp. 1355]
MNCTFQKGQEVKQEFGGPVMKTIGFEPELIENVSSYIKIQNAIRQHLTR